MLLFHFLDDILCHIKVFNFDEIPMNFFFLLLFLRYQCLTQGQEVFLTCSLICVTALAPACRCMVHFEFVFARRARLRSFACGYAVVPELLLPVRVMVYFSVLRR